MRPAHVLSRENNGWCRWWGGVYGVVRRASGHGRAALTLTLGAVGLGVGCGMHIAAPYSSPRPTRRHLLAHIFIQSHVHCTFCHFLMSLTKRLNPRQAVTFYAEANISFNGTAVVVFSGGVSVATGLGAASTSSCSHSPVTAKTGHNVDN